MAKQASERNLVMLAGLADDLRGSQATGTGQGHQSGCGGAGQCVDLAFQGIDPHGGSPDVGQQFCGQPGQDLAEPIGPGLLGQPGDEAVEQVESVQSAGGYVEFGVELMEMPAQPVGHLGAFDDQVVAVVDQQLQRPGGVVVAGEGEVGLAQRSAGDGERVDGVGLAAGAGAAAGAGHELRWHPHDGFPGSEQGSFQAGRDVATVFDRPHPILRELASCPVQQLPVSGIGRTDCAFTVGAADLVDCDHGVGVFVDVDSQHHHHG
jgi:hypothetical protein